MTLGEGVITTHQFKWTSSKKTWALRHLNKFHNLYIKPNIPQGSLGQILAFSTLVSLFLYTIIEEFLLSFLFDQPNGFHKNHIHIHGGDSMGGLYVSELQYPQHQKVFRFGPCYGQANWGNVSQAQERGQGRFAIE